MALKLILLYTLLWADNFKMAAICELHCMLLALKFGCMKICTVQNMMLRFCVSTEITASSAPRV